MAPKKKGGVLTPPSLLDTPPSPVVMEEPSSVIETSDIPVNMAAIDYTPSKPTESLFAYDLSFIRQEILGLKKQLHLFEAENSKLAKDLFGVTERVEQLEQENIYLKQQIAEKSALEETSNKINSLEKQVEETKTWAALFKPDDMGSKLSSLAKQVEETTSILKQGNHSQISSFPKENDLETVLGEQARRAKKAFNIRVRGIANGGKPLEEATDLLISKLSHVADGFDTAWRSKFDDNVLFIKFRSLSQRNAALRLRAKLKGTFIYMDDDLTNTQWLARKKIILEAKEKGQRVVFIDGKPRFFDLPQ
ncbi:hypothetical protein O6H91_02G138100 [Diphasiastrum complanatum]|uniref:Uncharacterized protein n=1 Tax=Diphasiastrum complanatum TaxID=34168 RepID=A0ACC2EKZ5_DIPCM|nr:hypothetical protein O6H91_02G138100 [Diphasiastrum complanatum]